LLFFCFLCLFAIFRGLFWGSKRKLKRVIESPGPEFFQNFKKKCGVTTRRRFVRTCTRSPRW
jgi:hypothetical protein